MNTIRRIAKNTLVLLAAQMVSMILGFFYMMYAARYLGAEEFGLLNFALAFTGMFGILADLGLSTLTIREVARDKSLAGKYLGNIILMKVFLVVITFCLIAIAINLIGYPKKTIIVVYLVALSVFFTAFTVVLNSIFQAFEKMEYQSIGGVLSSVLMLSGAFFAIKQGFSIIGFASIYFVVNAIILVYSFAICSGKFISPKIDVDWGFWKPTIKAGISFGLTGIFVTIFYWIDSVMLSLMKGDVVVGWYNASYRLIMMLLFIPSILNVTIFPSMSKFYLISKDTLRFSYQKYFKYMVIIGIPIGVAITLLADRIILLIFGIEYTSSVIALQILVWSSVFIFASSAFSRLIESTNRQILLTKVAGLCVVVNVILNLLLIPKFSYIGASIATVITEGFSFTYQFFIISKTEYAIPKRIVLYDILKTITASILMGIFITYFRDISFVILIILSALIYFLSIYILRGFDKTDIDIIKKLKVEKMYLKENE